MELPKGVHKVTARGREYHYFQLGRGGPMPGPRTRLPDDPTSPQFWQAIRAAQGTASIVRADTVGAMIDAYETSPHFDKLTEGSKDQYRRALRLAREAWGNEPVAGLRPVHVVTVMDGLADLPGKANTFLGTMRALSKWARGHDYILNSLTEGVSRYPTTGGHKPWTPTQMKAVESLTGVVRRGIMLGLYTGQRGSDIVRLGFTDIDDNGFRLTQRKTGREIWCPILPELAAEMATWERRPGPFLLQESGQPYTRKLLSKHFMEARASIPSLAKVTIHGLRSTAVIRLRQTGLSTGQIGDIIGMSMAMIERYCRFADKKAGGQAAAVILLERQRNATVKRVENRKTET